MNKPKAYQQGWVEFYKLKFKVNSDVLIPRPETELLVDEVLDFVKKQEAGIKNKDKKSLIPNSKFLILDVGTGSGAIAISVAKNAPNVKIIATDISAKALKVAIQNAKLHEVNNKIIFIKSDLLSFFYSNTAQYQSKNKPDIIVTNLPYIPTARIPYLDSSVRDFEPSIALNGGEDGFDLYRKLFQQLSLTPRRCKAKLIVGEIDYTHGELAILEAQKYFPNSKVEVKKDLAHKQRILIIKSVNN